MDVSELLSTIETKAKKSVDNPAKKAEDRSFDNVMNSISSNWSKEPASGEVQKLKEELQKANAKIQTLETSSRNLTKNEEKVIAAIRSESIEQKTEMPIISYSKFRKVYKVSSDYYRPSINSLLQRGLITQKEATFSGNVKTYRWKIIQQ